MIEVNSLFNVALSTHFSVLGTLCSVFCGRAMQAPPSKPSASSSSSSSIPAEDPARPLKKYVAERAAECLLATHALARSEARSSRREVSSCRFTL